MSNDVDLINAIDGCYLVCREEFVQTLTETDVDVELDIGSLVLRGGRRFGSMVWLLENPRGLSLVFVEGPSSGK